MCDRYPERLPGTGIEPGCPQFGPHRLTLRSAVAVPTRRRSAAGYLLGRETLMNGATVWMVSLVVTATAAAATAPTGASALGSKDRSDQDQRSRFSGVRAQPERVQARPDGRSYRTNNWDTSARVERRVDEL